MRKLFVAIGIALIAVSAPAARQKGAKGNGGKMDNLKKTLGLNDDQATQIGAILKTSAAENAALWKQVQSDRASSMQLLVVDPTNIAAAQKLMNDQERAEHTIHTNTLVAQSQVMNVLNMDQRKKWVAMMQAKPSKSDDNSDDNSDDDN